VRAAYEKLGVHTRTAAVAALFGLDADLVDPTEGA
jgi:DNA-binding CsgD family transcriptional regulator